MRLQSQLADPQLSLESTFQSVCLFKDHIIDGPNWDALRMNGVLWITGAARQTLLCEPWQRSSPLGLGLFLRPLGSSESPGLEQFWLDGAFF